MSTSNSEWKNMWRQLYEEEFGPAETEKRLSEQFNYSKPGFGSGLGLWFKSKLLETVICLVTSRSGSRAVHAHGVGATGTARILDDANLPENDFFRPGREFKVTVRHSNGITDDDAASDGRGTAIRLHDDVTEAVNSGGTTLDLLMTTGKVNPFENVYVFLYFSKFFKANCPEEKKKELAYRRPANLRGILEFLRRAPDSFTHMKYVAHSTYLLESRTGSKHHIRFRLVPEDVSKMAEESGLLGEQDQREPWKMDRIDTETKPNNYLRERFRRDLEERELLYYIEFQIHPDLYSWTSDAELFNVCKEWDTDQCPWKRLAEVTVTKALDEQQSAELRFDTATRPVCLSYPPAQSQYDYNSLPHVREVVYSAAQARRK